MDVPNGKRPLDGVVVLDLGQIYNGPYATLLMALQGATVIKIEPPTGDLLRGRDSAHGGSLPFIMLNSSKQSMTLDLKTPQGRDLLKQMAGKADVLVENFRPGVMDRLGVGAAVLRGINPGLVYASSPGYGAEGKYKDFAAMDLTVQAMVGMMSITGFPDRPPVKAGAAVCDFLAGIHLYGAVLTALYQRAVTGEGATVEAAMFDAAFPSLLSGLGLHFGLAGDQHRQVERVGNRHSGNAEAPYDVYATSDGYVAIICVSEAHWGKLVDVMGQPQLATDARFVTRKARVANIDEMDEYVAGWTSLFTTASIVKYLSAVGVPCAPVRSLADVVDDPHIEDRGILRRVEHPTHGTVQVLGTPFQFQDSSMVTPRPSPGLGQHSGDVLAALLGLDEAEISKLAADGII